MLLEGSCVVCLPAIGGNRMAISPKKISAQDIVKVRICTAGALNVQNEEFESSCRMRTL